MTFNEIKWPVIALVDPGVFIKIEQPRVTEFGNQQELLASIIESRTVTIENAGELGGQPVGIKFMPYMGNLVQWIRIPEITINTWWKIDAENGVQFPCWFKTLEGLCIEQSLVWKVPAGLKLWLVTGHKISQDTHIELLNCFLLMSEEGKAGTFLPPMANLFDDGAVCNGNEYKNKGATALGQMADVIAHLCRSPWNNDLSRGGDDSSRRWFGFTISDKPEQTCKSECANGLNKISHTIYNELPLK